VKEKRKSSRQEWNSMRKKGEEEMKKLIRFLKDEEGVTAIEYGLIAALIAVAIVLTVKGVGTGLNSTFTTVQTNLP
jgi:pilus assembly protein Flp/PilA